MLLFDRLLLWHWAGQALRIAFVFYMLGCLWILGRLVGMWFRLAIADPFAERLVEVALGFAALSLAVRGLGAAGLAVREALLGLLLAPPLLLLWMLRRGSVPRFSFPGLERKWPLGVLVALPLPMALAPAVSYDALVYHLRFPEMTLWTGRWAVDPTNSPSLFPGASETLYLLALSVDGSGICAQLVHYAFFLLSVGALIALGRSVAPFAGDVAALLFASIPAAGIVAGWSWADMTLCFALLASGLALIHGEIGAAAALLGLAAATKYSGLLLSAPLAAAAAVVSARRRRIAALVPSLGAGALVALPWYAANWILVGNPVYPMLPRIFGGNAETAGRIFDWNRWSRGSLDSDVGGPALIIALLAALVWCVRTRRHLGAVAVVLSASACLLPFAPSSRILLPVLAGGCLLAGFAAEAWRQRTGARWPLIVAGFFAARGGLLIAAHNALFFNPVPCAAGVETSEAYRARNFPPAALFERAEEKLPQSARVLVFGESRLFGFPRPTIAPNRVDPPPVIPFLRGAAGPDEVLARLRRRGITNMLVSRDALRPAPEAAVWQAGLSAGELAMLNRTIERCRPVDRQGQLILLELPAASGS